MNKWTEDEIIIAFALYCITPAKEMTLKNQVVHQLAGIIPHSASSIIMRMKNFQYLDPSVNQGMGHVAKADISIFNQFKHDWGALSIKAEQLTGLALFDSSPLHGAKPLSDLTSHAQVSRERHFFKRSVLSAYDNTCYISGCAIPRMLIASHIKPYKACRSAEDRVNPQNGICLNTFYDKAFDSGIITITPQRKIYVSDTIKTDNVDPFTRKWILDLEGTVLPKVARFAPRNDYLEYHNDIIFIREVS